MLFNSFEFAIFLPIVFALYWSLSGMNYKLQNLIIIIASYVFYGWWDWRFLLLRIFSSFFDFMIGIKLSKQDDAYKRKVLLLASIVVNIGLLGFFKYFNFFIESFLSAFSLFGRQLNIETLNIILPLGISFYTFQTLAYSIDTYKKKFEPTNDVFAFFAFSSFFPILAAGPIERASNLLPQFYKQRKFEYDKGTDGMRQILWGLFKKIAIADNCVKYVNDIFKNYIDYSGSTLLIGGVLFAFQVYCDFSGYSDIAIGTARLFGINLMRNFAFPYFSRDIAEFWRRWHISLTTWFRDYIYIPLGGSRCGNWQKTRNVLIIFLVSGLWHGANWTFVAWGVINAIYFLPLMLINKNRKNLNNAAANRLLPSFGEVIQITFTFLLVVIAWVFFRAENIGHAFDYLNHLLSASLASMPQVFPRRTFALITFLMIVEWVQRFKQHALHFDGMNLPGVLRWCTYYLILFLTYYFGIFDNQAFIYTQF